MSFPFTLKSFLQHILQSKLTLINSLDFYSPDNDFFPPSFLKDVFAEYIIMG